MLMLMLMPSFSVLRFFPSPAPNVAFQAMSPSFLLIPSRSLFRSFAAIRAGADSTAFDLHGYWTSLAAEIESDLAASLPVRYPERIHEAMRHPVLSAAGAKRAAPAICVAACELVGGERSAAIPAASALVIAHAACLVHDDLPCMDAAQHRRGRAPTHELYGLDLAVFAGDALLPLAFAHVACRTPSPRPVPHAALLRVLAEIARAVGPEGTAAGQLLDLAESTAGAERDALLVLEKKFGEISECAAVCGGILGGAGDEEAEALRRYGRAVGVLYQLADDIASNVGAGEMRSNTSVVRTVGINRALELAEELRSKAKKELERFERYGDRVLPLHGFVDYAAEKGVVVESGSAAAAVTGSS